jgi:hypothetical protein
MTTARALDRTGRIYPARAVDWYVVSAHNWFKGPIRQGTEEELERIEAQYGAPAVAPGEAPAS